MRTLLCLTAVAFAAAGAGAFAPQKSDEKKPDEKKSNKELIVGTWELVKTSQGDLGGVVLHLEFTKDGKMKMNRVEDKQKTPVYEAKYKIEGEKEDKLPYESITEGVDKKETLTIKKLTDKEMTFVDDDGIVEEFKRVKDEEKKKDGKPDQSN
jgi:uncharacterized protein (TIGR03066 family)